MFPGGDQPDLSGLLAQAQQMQEQLIRAQQEMANARVEGSAAGGKVTATVTGTGELVGLTISPDVVDPAETEELADLVLAAVRDASAKAQQQAQQALGPLAGGLDLPGMPGSGPGHPGLGG